MAFPADVKKGFDLFQKKQNLLFSAISRDGISGITNLAMRYYEAKKEPIKTNYVPTALHVEITTACNLRCTICEHTYMQKVGGHLDLDGFKRLIDSTPSLLVINITGIGENFMNPQFLDMVSYAKRKGLYVWFTDNMTMLFPNSAQKLLDAGVDLIVASLDGATKETFEGIRIGAKFESVIRNTKDLIRMRDEKGLSKPLIGINMVVTKSNYTELEKMVRLCHEMKIDKLMFITILISDNNDEFALYSVSKKDIDEVLDKAKKTAEELGVEVINWPNTRTQKSEKTGCDFPWKNPYITYNGDVLPCCLIPQESGGRSKDENIMGNILKEDLKTIWNNEKYQSFRKKIKTKDPPSSCKICPKFYGLA